MIRGAACWLGLALAVTVGCSSDRSDSKLATSESAGASSSSAPRPCLPPDFGSPVSVINPSGTPLPPNASSVFQHALIQALPCAFTGTEVLNGDPTSMAVHVAPLTDVERGAIAKVAAAFPNYKLVGVEARQSLAEANAQMTAINSAVHRDSTVAMGIDGQVTVTVYGVAKGDASRLEEAILAASRSVPAGTNALPPIVNITSEPSGFSQ